ncbi:potassium channel family protein [Leptospira kmetyi]|uniref:Potassium channel domain-containing protein n=1 Tax=Leptospira kmetyi TaxID=408139 RepID=A0ABX4N4Y1_9LEPT|nr:potassium channel family protein [Leptospira kmetyi]PJZ28386.1 hypothetical protein CH378_18075 [Leptospira kmetyi]
MNRMHDNWDQQRESHEPLTTGYLLQDFKELNICSIAQLDENVKMLQDKKLIKLTDASEIDLDNEHRLYSPEIMFQRRYFKFKHLNLYNSSKITFINCVINGDLLIGAKESQDINISLDNCIVFGRIILSNLMGTMNVSLNNVNANELSIQNGKVVQFRMEQSKLFELTIVGNRISNFYTRDNAIEYVTLADNDIRKIVFDHNQVNFENLIIPKTNAKYFRLRSEFNYFKVITSSYTSEDHEMTRHKTLSFLSSLPSIRIDRDAYSKVSYSSLINSRSLFNKLLLGILGGFVKPMRILLIIAATIFTFSVIYYSSASKFKVKDNFVDGLDIVNAIYFSGMTFATISFGDIVPLNTFCKLIAFLQGFLGIFLSGAFLVTILNKYFRAD